VQEWPPELMEWMLETSFSGTISDAGILALDRETAFPRH